MIKVITPRQDEIYEIYSDFTNKLIQGSDPDNFGPLNGITITSEYGSKYDSNYIYLHLDDDDIKEVIDFLRQKVQDKTIFKDYEPNKS